MNYVKSTTPRVPAEEIAAYLKKLGFKEGAPKNLPPAILALDQKIFSRLICPSCRRASHEVKPFHCGTAYRLVAFCRFCPDGQEV